MIRHSLLAIALLAGTPLAARAQAATPAPKPTGRDITLTGTVIDLSCRFSKGSQGPEHLACFEGCVKAGVPIGILGTDGKLYIPAKHEESQTPMLAPYAERQVTVTGKVYQAAGANVIEVATVKAAS